MLDGGFLGGKITMVMMTDLIDMWWLHFWFGWEAVSE